MQVLDDLRYALRALRSHAGSTLVIIASLAIGIGANTAIFSVANALLLKPLPYPDPDRLAALWLRSPGINIPQDWPSPGQYIDILTGEPLVRGAVDLARPQRHADPRRPARAHPGAADLVEPLSDARGAAVARPAVAARRGRAGQAADRGAEPPLLDAHVRRRYRRRRPEHHAERRRRRRGRHQEPVHGRRRPRPRLPAEQRGDADGREPRATRRLPPAAARRRRGQAPGRRELQLDGAAEAGRDHGAGAGRHHHDRGADPRQGQARPDIHDQRRAAARSGRRQRPADGAGALRIGRARAAGRLRERRQPPAHARQRPAEGSGHPDGARRVVAPGRGSTADGERAARRCSAAPSVWCSPRQACSWFAAEPGQHPASGRHPDRSNRPRLHLRRVAAHRHRLRPGARDSSRRRGSDEGAECQRPQRAGRRRLRQHAPAAAQPARRLRTGAVADAPHRRRAPGAQLRAAAGRAAGVQSGPGRLDAARFERPSVRHAAGRQGVLPSDRRSHRRRPRRDGSRRGIVAAVHLLGGLGVDQRRGLPAAARPGTAGRHSRRIARLLPDDADCAGAGTKLRERRHDS